MNTPAHLIFGATVFGKTHNNRRTAAAILGAAMPDLSLYFLAIFSLYYLELSPQYVFGELYFSPLWQSFFAIDNSFFIWSALFGLALWQNWILLYAFSGGALLHIALDFLFHHNDGRAHLWPFTDWVFQSPVSYWDINYFAAFIIPIEFILTLICCIILIKRHTSYLWRIIIVLLFLMQCYAALSWFFFFG